MYGFLYVADREEGLIEILAATLLDGDPRNNFLKRDVVFNPEGILKGRTILRSRGLTCTCLVTRGWWWWMSIIL